MAGSDERIALITASVLVQAQAECDEWHEKAERHRRDEMDHFEQQLLEEMHGRVHSAADRGRREASERVSRTARELREALLRRREQIRAAVFAEARAELLRWTETEEYREALLRDLRELSGQYDHAASTLLVRERDLVHAAAFREILGEALMMRADPGIRIGGFALENDAAQVRIDQTLDTRLRDADGWFLEHSGLAVT